MRMHKNNSENYKNKILTIAMEIHDETTQCAIIKCIILKKRKMTDIVATDILEFHRIPI